MGFWQTVIRELGRPYRAGPYRKATRRCCKDAQVARPEVRHERDTQALQNVWDDFRIVEQKRNEAQAANAALAAAGQKLREELAEVGDHTDMIWDGALLHEWDAALSDTGEGWLPPEVREPAKRALRFDSSLTVHSQFHLGYRDDSQQNCPCCQAAWAALDALGGT